MLSHFTTQNKPPTFDRAIIDNFYTHITVWMKQNPKENVIDNAQRYEERWEDYVSRLPAAQQQRAKELAYIVIHQPQTVPATYSYMDIFKAAFLIAIPDILSISRLQIAFRGFRNDQIFGRVKLSPQADGSYQLTADPTASSELFEDVIATHEMGLGTASVFHKFSAYLLALNTFNQSTVTHCARMFIDDLAKNFHTLMLDGSLTTAITAANILPSQWMSALPRMFAWYLGAYIMKAQLPQIGLSDSKIFKINYHVAVLNRIDYRCDSNIDTYSSIIDQYIRRAKDNINLGCSPAITAKDVQQQEYVYRGAVLAREEEPANSENAQGAKKALGLLAGESARIFICDNYSFSDDSFSFPDISTRISNEETLLFFFLLNINFLRQVDREAYGYEQYRISIARLWNAFICDPRCPEEIKNRGIVINTHTFRSTELDVINKICKPGDIGVGAGHVFSEMLYQAARSEKNGLLLALVNALFVNPLMPIDDTETPVDFHHRCMIVFMQDMLNSLGTYKKKDSVAAMLIVLQSSAPLHNKLDFVGIIAQGELDSSGRKSAAIINVCTRLKSYFGTRQSDDISGVFQRFLTTEEKSYFAAFSTKNLQQLVERYEQFKHNNANVQLIAWQINNTCNRAQLAKLATELQKFIAPCSKKVTLFPSPCCLGQIVRMIETENFAVDILLALKKVAHTRKDRDDLDQRMTNLCRAIDAFFSEADPTQDQTVGGLLWRVRSIQVTNLTERQSFEMVPMMKLL